MMAAASTQDGTISARVLGHGSFAGTTVQLHPGAGSLIKNEPGTIIWREALPDGTEAAIKLYLRGFGSWLRSRITAFRARREFKAMRTLEDLGIPCASPLFWAHGRFGPRGWGELLATRWIPDCRPLTAIVGRDADAAARPDLCPIFSAVARMHDAGLRHGTLLVRNILAQGDRTRPAFFFIDMPRSHRFPRTIRGTRMAIHDLLYMCDSLSPNFGQDHIRQWLTAYRMPEQDHGAFLAALASFRNTSNLRRLIGAEFNVRFLLANALAFSAFRQRRAKG